MKTEMYVCGVLFLWSLVECNAFKTEKTLTLGTNKESGKQMLNAEDARKALIKLVEESGNEILDASLAGLKSDTVVNCDTQQICIGKWRCNLATGTFVLSLVAGPHFAEFSGVFQKTSQGGWKAEITSQKQT